MICSTCFDEAVCLSTVGRTMASCDDCCKHTGHCVRLEQWRPTCGELLTEGMSRSGELAQAGIDGDFMNKYGMVPDWAYIRDAQHILSGRTKPSRSPSGG